MKKTKNLLILLSFLTLNYFPINSIAQCDITASGYPIEICAGEPVILSSSGACGYLLNNDYNNGTIGIGWASNANPMFNNPCGPGLDGTIHSWIGSATNFPRHLTTDTFDVSVGGCQVKFEMKYGDQQTAQDCEDPDATNEGVHLQYSVNYGGTWTDINYWAPTTNISGPLYVWNPYIENVPAIANTTHTMFRWWQSLTSGNTWDHWGLDNCQIYCLASQNVHWAHGPNVFNPPPVYPTSDTMFIVTITDTINNQSATDTVWIIVNQIPTADFTVSKPNICKYETVTVTYTGTGTPAASYSWDFDGGTTIPAVQTGPGPYTVQWANNGLHTISLSVTEKNCNSTTISNTVEVFPAPLISFIPSIIDGCEPLTVSFTDNTTPAVTSWFWDFGDGNTSTDQNPVHTFTSAGVYDIIITATTSHGCTGTYTSLDLINVYAQPVANFAISPEIATIQEPTVTFTDLSQKASFYSWDFGDNTTSSVSSPTHVYSEVGTYTITLIVYNDHGCADTISKEVMVIDDVLTFPNVITPNNDGANDKFVITNLENYISNTLVIYNRWGKKIYEMDNYQNDWDAVGVSDGVYYYILTFHGYLRDGHEEGSLTIIR